MLRIKAIALGTVILVGCSSAMAASSEDIDKLNKYAIALGRAVACGANFDDASRRVGRWMDRKFPPGSSDQGKYLMIFVEGIRYHAVQQREGKNPDSCAAVLRSFVDYPWP